MLHGRSVRIRVSAREPGDVLELGRGPRPGNEFSTDVVVEASVVR